MPVRVLGCSGAIAAGSHTTSFLVDDDILIDAGTGVGTLALGELERIDHIFVTHAHLDHIASIALMADAVQGARRAAGRPAIQVHALPDTLAALCRHVFNDVIWPDFTRLPDPSAPVLQLRPVQVGERIAVGGRLVEVLPARHTVAAAGYAVWGDPHGAGAAWVYTGDTAPNRPLFTRLAALRVRTLVIETAFGDADHDIAERSAHLSPRMLVAELAHLRQAPEIWVTHVKPGKVDEVMADIAGHRPGMAIRALQAGQRMALREHEALSADMAVNAACPGASGACASCGTVAAAC